MARKIVILVGVAALSISGAIGIQFWYRGRVVRAQTRLATDLVAALPPIVPATVSFQEILRSSGKPDLLSTERQYGVRTDGSEAQINQQHTNAGNVYLTHWKIALSDGTKAQGDDVTNTMTAVKLPPASPLQRASERWDPNSECAAQANGRPPVAVPAGHETLLGIDAVRMVLSDSGTVRITVWRAPGLNCLELRRLAEFKNPDGSTRDTSDLIATKIGLGEPDGALFLLPKGIENVSYSERHKRMAAAAGSQLNAAELQAVQRQDGVFNQYRITP